MDRESELTYHLKSILSDIIRVGTVTSTRDDDATARVQFEDRNEVVSYHLPILVRNSRYNKDYWMPDVDEKVLCLFLPIGLEQGFILGSFYSDVTRPPRDTKEKRAVVFSDDAFMEYDRVAHLLSIFIGPSSVEIDHSGIRLNAPRIDLNEQ